VAWSRGEKPEVFGGDRTGVSSAGVALRVNLFGYAVGAFDIVRPLRRPGQDGPSSFSWRPGF
jgi:hypothetical protein